MTHHSFAKFAMSDCHIHGICHRISVVVVVLIDRRRCQAAHQPLALLSAGESSRETLETNNFVFIGGEWTQWSP
jgi:hypothetical protein